MTNVPWSYLRPSAPAVHRGTVRQATVPTAAYPCLALSPLQFHTRHTSLVQPRRARSNGIARSLEVDHRSIDEDLTLVGGVEAVEDVHQSGLAGAVLPEQTEDLTGLNGQVDRVIGQDAGESLGYVSQLQLQKRPPVLMTVGSIATDTMAMAMPMKNPRRSGGSSFLMLSVYATKRPPSPGKSRSGRYPGHKTRCFRP